MAAMMAAACSHKTADKTTQVVENSRLTHCNVSLNGLHFTKSLNGAEKQVSDSAGIVTFRAKPQADFSVILTEKYRKMMPPSFSWK